MSSKQDSVLNKKQAIKEFTSDLITKLHLDYLLVNRICYKVKHQFRRQRQFQYLIQYKKGLKSLFYLNKKVTGAKSKEQLMKELFIEEGIESEAVKAIQDVVLKIGGVMLEMLKLKLYPTYTLIILGIMSRTHVILEYLIKNKEKIADALLI